MGGYSIYLTKNLTRISSLQRALSILDFLATSPKGYGVKEIAYSKNMNISTCYHILNTLLDEEYVLKNSEGVYILGPKIPYLNHTFQKSSALENIILKHMNKLNEESGETTVFVRLNHRKLLVHSILESRHDLHVSALHEGYSGNEHARASCQVIMAYWTDEEVNDYFKDYSFEQFTEKTPKNLEELKLNFEVIRNRGYCLDEEEKSHGVCCIAAPVFNFNKKAIASFSIVMPKERYMKRKKELIDMVRKTAENGIAYIKYLEKANTD